MSLLTDIFRLTPPTLKPNYCPQTEQQRVNDYISGTRVTFLIQSGNFLYNYGPATPAPDNRIFPWFNTDDGLWWQFKFGLWVSPRPRVEQDTSYRIMWKPPVGTPESAVWSKDGGSGGDPSVDIPTATTGALWQVDHDMDGRVPLGAGLIPGTATTVSISGTGGNAKHTLTEAEGATGIHTHAFGVADLFSDDGFFATGPLSTVPSYNGHFITGGGSPLLAAQTSANLFTLPSGSGGAGVPTPTPFDIIPPYAVVWWLKPTSRIWFTRSA